MRILLTFWWLCLLSAHQCHDWILSFLPEMWQKLRKQIFCIMVCLNFWADYQILIYSYHQEMMKSMGSHGSLSLQFMMEVMVWHFVSECHKVLNTLIVTLPLKSCSGDFSANPTDVVFLFFSSCDLLLWSVVIWSSKLIIPSIRSCPKFGSDSLKL